MPLHPREPHERLTPAEPVRPRDAGEPALCRAPDDLSALEDDELYVLESDRCLLPGEWERVEAELARRRRGRSPVRLDAALAAPMPTALTLGDLERVAGRLEVRIERRIGELEARTRALRWWTLAAPLVWVLGVGAWLWATYGGRSFEVFTSSLLG